LYADVVLTYSPNSREAKILRPHYQKICEKVNANMSQNGTCTHIKVTGVRCGSPALRGEQFCYFHQNAHRGVRRPKQSRLHPIALIEDEESIQYALMEVINALMRNTIDYKRATLILRALHIAVKNASRVKIGVQKPVQQVPEYAPWTEEQAELATAAELPAVAEAPYKPVAPGHLHFWENQYEGGRVLARQARNASVGTDAFVRPGREATVPAPSTTTPLDAQTDNVGTAAPGCAGPEATAPTAEATAPTAESSTSPEPATNPGLFPSHNFKHSSEAISQPVEPQARTRKPPQPALAPTPRPRKSSAHVTKHR
jgi:hypothetical protein